MSVQKTYTVFGATGNIGKVVAQNLLKEGHQVQIVVRSEEKAADLIKAGAQAMVGSLEDRSFVDRVLAHIDAAFLMIPPHFGVDNYRAWQNEIGAIQAQAIERNDISHVVQLSSVGAQLSDGTGPIAGLHDQEQRLNQIPGLNVVNLRPAYFLENLLEGIQTIHDGFVGSVLHPDVRFPMIATRDIGAVAAQVLSDLDFQGSQVRELQGAGNYCLKDVTEALSVALNRPIQFVQYQPEDARGAMEGMGMPSGLVSTYLELFDAINQGRITYEPRSAATTTPTSLKDFVPTLLQASKLVPA